MPSSTTPPEAAVPKATRAPWQSDRELAIAHLAAELGIAPGAITVLTVERVDWSDASLGCAKPGMMYAQVITPGYRIVLEVNGKHYEYHTGEGRIIRCKP